MSRIPYFTLLFLVSLAAGAALWYATPAGLGLTNDSAAYIGGARSILAGSGYSDIWLDSELEAITHYPPLVSLTLSVIGLTGLDPYRGARLLHILLFAASAGWMGVLGWRMTQSQAAGIFLALLFATNAELLRIHAQVLSEPLFIFLSLASFLAFSAAMDKQSQGAPKPWPVRPEYCLLLSGWLTGLAFLTRYSALALAVTFLIAIFLLSKTSRFRRGAFFLAGAIPPIAAWFIRNSLVADTATNRIFQYNPIQIENIRTGLWNIADFLTPTREAQTWLFGSGALHLLLALFGLALLAWLAHRAYCAFFAQSAVNSLTFTTALYVFGYLGAILFSMSFFDASTKFQHRILSPLYISWIILLIAMLHSLRAKAAKGAQEQQSEKPASFPHHIARQIRVPLALGLTAALLASTVFNFQQSLTELRHIDGLGYASWRWRQAEVLAIIRDLPPEIIIYSNSPPAVYHVTGRASRVIPTPKNPASRLPREEYEQALTEMREELLAGRAVLALFNVSDIEDAWVDEIALQFDGLTLLVKAQGHALYGKP